MCARRENAREALLPDDQKREEQYQQERDCFKAKELQFDELAGIKLLLYSEIELYRNMLNEADQAQGYRSPLSCSSFTKGALNSRKRRRIQAMGTPIGPLSKLTEQEKMSLFGAPEEEEPTQTHALGSGHGQQDEDKDQEESMMSGTPGNLEGLPLQLSGMDLNKGSM